MQRIFIGTGLFAAMVFAAPTAQAQQRSMLTFGVSGGLTVPNGDLGDFQTSGLNLNGHIILKPSATPFSLRGDLGYWTTGSKTILGQTSPIQGNTNWLTLTGNAVYAFEGAKDAVLVPYVIGGLGLYNASRGIGNGTNVGINGGGGVTFKLSGFDAFAEGRLHNVFAGDGSVRLIPVSFGIIFRP